MAFPLAAIPVAVGVAEKLLGKKAKGPDYRQAIAELRSSKPLGYLTPADLRAAELTRGRLQEGVTTRGTQAGYEVARRFRARGLAGSPAEERSRARLESETLLGTEHAGNTAEEQLYNIRTGREAFERQKALSIFGAQIGAANQESARQAAQDAGFWNSLNEFMPTILSASAPKSADTTGWTLRADGSYGPPVQGPPAPGGYEPDIGRGRNF